MAKPLIGHRTKEISELQRNISNNLKKLFYTENQVMLSTSSGSGFMEGAIRSCTAKKAAVFSVGAFGKRWYKMAVSNGVPADLFEVEMGQATSPQMVEEALSTGEYDLITITHNETSTGVMNPIKEIADVVKKYPEVVFCVDTVSSAAGSKIEVDQLGIDICITSTQKALGLPPGLAICTMSNKAYERAKTVKNRGLYFDMVEIYDTINKKDHQYPSTPNVSLMYALEYQLDQIMEEGLENRFARHIEMAQYVRGWAKKHFEIFADEKYLSNTLTTVKNTRGISVKDLNGELAKRGFMISNGYGDLKEKTFRIAHMADITLDEVKELIGHINEILNLEE
ncbi:MAG: alanine--glyoxylate aminotransferase family protein [Tissierellales bacterium]|nr:alanine--glyoxylate aminotransferase family protein [Tissierellales bacterium]MBN2828609.1 alanine--glyoxylate aminotransferase family protein [Tissierellales bacterium]